MARHGGISVLDVEAALESGDEDLLTGGGVVKFPRSERRPADERRPKNRTLRTRRLAELEEVQVLVVVPQTASAVKPPEEKKEEGVKMAVNDATNVTPAVRVVRKEKSFPCPICGDDKDEERFLVCRACSKEFDAYTDKVAGQILNGEKNIIALTKNEWVLSQLNLPLFEEEHKRALQERDNLHDWAVEQSEAELRALGKNISNLHHLFQQMVKRHEEREWPGRQSKAMRMWARLLAAQKVKTELEKRIAEMRKNNAAPAPAEMPTALTIAPAQSLAPPVQPPTQEAIPVLS